MRRKLFELNKSVWDNNQQRKPKQSTGAVYHAIWDNNQQRKPKQSTGTVYHAIYEPRQEKTCIRGFRPG